MKYKILLITIIVIATVLRVWQLGSVPLSLDWDEASLGYNAYSVLQTGRDEYGEFLPLMLRSFGDYKPGLYMYFIVPFLPLFGLSEIAVRLPAALIGIAAVIATYFLVRELFQSDQNKKSKKESSLYLEWKFSVPILTMLLLAISPWHLQFSRVAFESGVGMAINIFAALFFLKGRRKPFLLALSLFLAGTNVYVYQSVRVFTPLLMGLLTLVYWRDILKIPRKWLALAVVAGLIAILPMILYMVSDPNALARAKGVSIFSNPGSIIERSVLYGMQDHETGDVVGELLHNRRVEFVKTVISGYISHFDLNWLFITGDIERHHAPKTALLYLWELPLLLIGAYQLIFGAFSRKTKAVIFGWMLLAPIPASITHDVPHAVRTLNFLPTFQIVTAVGLLQTYLFIKQYMAYGLRLKSALYLVPFALYFIFIFFNIVYYLNQYFVQQNYFYAPHWQYGYKEAVAYVKNHKDAYQNVVVSDKVPLDQSYIFFLYHLQYPPEKYHQEVVSYLKNPTQRSFGSYTFRNIDVATIDTTAKNTLYVVASKEMPDTIKPIHTVYYPDGKPAIQMFEGK